jgi:hypothetical protein
LNNPANGGLRCTICEDVLDPKHLTNKEYVSEDALPSEKKLLRNRLTSNNHLNALSTIKD